MAEADIRLWVVGYWIETWNDPRYVAPQEFVGRYNRDTKRRLVEYLGSAKSPGHVTKFCGSSWCRFPQCENRRNGSLEFGDRYWSWPSGLAHYVEHHDVLLPAVFVDHVLGDSQSPPPIQYRPASIIPMDEIRKRKRHTFSVGVDFLWWSEWCKSNSTGLVRDLMERFDVRVKREAEAAMTEHEVYMHYLDLVLRRGAREIHAGRWVRDEVDKIT